MGSQLCVSVVLAVLILIPMKYQVLISILAPILASLYGLIPPVRGTFRCDDPSIQFQYQGDTISAKLLFQAILIPIIFIIFITEVSVLPTMGYLRMCKSAALSTACIYFRYWAGMSLNTIVNITLKTMASTPRPHFIETCHPDWSRVDCDQNDGNVLFDLSLCLNSNEAGSSLPRVNDSMKSFPSGHAQLAMCAASFFTVYVYRRTPSVLVYWCTRCLAVLYCVLAVYCAYTRLTDHRHHLVDVCTGSVLGTVLGVVSAGSLEFREEAEKKQS